MVRFGRTTRIGTAERLDHRMSGGDFAHSGDTREQAELDAGNDLRVSTWWGGEWARALNAISFAVKDHDRRFVHVSPGFADRLGTSPQQLIGLSDADLPGMAEADRYRIRAEEDTVISGNLPLAITVRFRQRDGWTGHGVGIRFPVAGPDGRPGVGSLLLDITEHVRAKERFALFMQHSGAFGAIKDLNQHYIWVTDTVAKHHGRHVDEVVGRTPAEVCDPEVAELELAQDTAMLEAGGGPMTFELRDRGAGDAPLVRRGTRFTFTDADGRTCIGSVFIDVTAEVEASARAAAAEERFTSFMRHNPAAAVMKDAEGRYLWANPAYFHTYRVDPDHFVGRTIHDLTDTETAAYATALDQQVMSSGQPLRDTSRHTRGDGSTGVDIGYRFPLPAPDGRTGLGAVSIDITELHEAREAAMRAEARYRELFEHSGIPIIVFDLGGKVVNANIAYAQMIGHSLSHLRSLHIRDLVTGTTAVKDKPRWDKLVSGEIGRYRSRAMLRHAKGTLSAAVATMSLISSPDGTPQYVYSVTDPVADIDTDLAPRAATGPVPQLEEERLCREEHTILTTLAAGGTLAEAGTALHLSRQGVNHHVTKLRRRLGLPERTRTAGLVARAYAVGILVPGTWPPHTAAPYS
ncbi:PAS domain-containing protein [Lentzea sp. HUAS12]|uniref:PAS domain-containing protein n=1 Tax=Lentzea sp. HUAS12 TaxID=2951806 RepID=UPI00209D6035|nr:PAS domain-containing protein [Lentzea sp. HUAS12]USX56363.1 PAS domain-containing protein [Lentzea sp. HUAS12]